MRQRGRGDTGAGVVQLCAESGARGATHQRKSPPSSELDGVAEQVVQHLAHACGVTGYPAGGSESSVRRSPDPSRGRARPQVASRRRCTRTSRSRPGALHLAGLDARQVERSGSGRAGGCPLTRSARRAVRVVGRRPPGAAGGPRHNPVQRRAQLVAQLARNGSSPRSGAMPSFRASSFSSVSACACRRSISPVDQPLFRGGWPCGQQQPQQHQQTKYRRRSRTRRRAGTGRAR